MKTFGDCSVQYGVVIDHNAYEYLRVSIEVPRGQNQMAIVELRGKPVGEIHRISNNEFLPIRYVGNKKEKLAIAENVGHAAGRVISDLL